QDQGREEETRATDTIRPATHGAPPAAEEHPIPGKLHPCPSVARLSGPLPDPWLCVPASRRVCLFREGLFAARPRGCTGGAKGGPLGQGAPISGNCGRSKAAV